MERHEGDDLPTSAFVGMEDGTYPLGTTAYENVESVYLQDGK